MYERNGVGGSTYSSSTPLLQPFFQISTYLQIFSDFKYFFCLSNSEIQTYCQNNGIHNSGDYGPLDISKSSTFEFLSEFFNEIFETFPDEQIHLGGDEVALDTCW